MSFKITLTRKPEHITDFLALEVKCFSSEVYDLISEDEFKRLFSKSSVLPFAVWEDNRLVGTAIIFIKQRQKIARIYSLAIDEHYRRMGVGFAMMEGIEQFLAGAGYRYLYLEAKSSNDEAIRFYTARKYLCFGKYKQFYKDGSSALRFKKELLFRKVEDVATTH